MIMIMVIFTARYIIYESKHTALYKIKPADIHISLKNIM